MKTVRCPQCNLANWETVANCNRCGLFLEPSARSDASPESETESGARSEFVSNVQQSFSDTPQDFRRNDQQPRFQPNYKAAEKKTGMAIASMVIGVVGCFLSAPVGLVLGIVALVRANKRPFEYGGKGFAIAGIALNVIGVLTLPIVAAIAIPNFLAGMRAANETSAVRTMLRIADAENEFREAMAGRCGDIKALIAARLLEVDLANEEKNGYRFMVVNLPSESAAAKFTPHPLAEPTERVRFTIRPKTKRCAPPIRKADPPVKTTNRSVSAKKAEMTARPISRLKNQIVNKKDGQKSPSFCHLAEEIFAGSGSPMSESCNDRRFLFWTKNILK